MSEEPVGTRPIHDLDPNPVMWNLPPEERSGKPLLVMMHGLGSHEGDLFGLNRFMPDGLVVASLRAPLRYGGGFAWFDADLSRGVDASLLDASVHAVLRWIDDLEMAPSSIGLMGFSQGGCMALQLIRQSPERFDYALQLSGFLGSAEHPGDSRLAARTPLMPVFSGRGDLDTAIPGEAIDQTDKWLKRHVAAQQHRYPMAHTISQEELADIVEFVSARLT